MNPQFPSVTNIMQPYQLPAVPQLSFNFGQGSWEQPFSPDTGLVSNLRSKLISGEYDINQAAQELISSGNFRQRGGLSQNIEEVKKGLVGMFGGQRFAGPQGQVGYFNQRSYGYIPETTKNVVTRVTGMGPTSQTKHFQGALPTIPNI